MLKRLAISAGVLCAALVAGCGTGESTDEQAVKWFRTVVGVDPSAFSDIQHYTDQGIDFSHHFRFRYQREDDLLWSVTATR
jgi:hypothetical protein